ncbi:hypothetical protein [Elioraea rosea]|uniref:hypothetical protein n=1 Tax=Elioraea rosea TaxID=2492390 RepID=UPI001182AAA8|nr:hypothetical protein [Elioraea rosea]
MSPHIQALSPADRVVAFLDLVKSLRWPAVAVFVLVLVQVPLHGVLGLVPGLDVAPRTVLAGHLPVRVDEQGLPAANDEVVHAVRAMDGDLLRIFLDMDQTAVYCGSLDAEYRAGLRRLAHLNLVEPRYEPQRGGDCAQNTVMTEQGKRVQTYLISLMVSLLKG